MLEGRSLYAVIFASSFIFFGVMFFVAWAVSAYAFRRIWPRFLVEEKADWASRVNSQIHAFIVVPAFLITLSTTEYDYTTWYNDNGNTVPSSVIMAISLGYFSFDFFVLVYYRVPLWMVFVGHHIVASTPYFTYLFHPCEAGNIILSVFLLVETATIFLNFQTWMEKLGYAKSKLFTWMFYLTYVSWFLTRVLLPVFCVYIVWKLWFGEVTLERGYRGCLAPGLVCSHLITIFCWVVFFFVLTPDLLQRWKETPDALEERLQEVRRKRRNQIVSQEQSRSNTPGGASGATSRRSSRHHPRSTEPIADGAAASSGRSSVEDNSLPSSAVDVGEAATPIDSDDDIMEFEANPRSARDNEPFDYEMVLHMMMSDNPYTTRPEGRPELRELTLEELRHDGISLERRTTAYATTTMRL